MDAFAIARLAIGAAFLAVAAVQDLRTRRVRDPVWIVLGTAGFAVLAVQLVVDSAYFDSWFFLLSAAILFYAVFYGRPILDEDGIHLRPLRILVLAIAALAFAAGVAIPVPVSTISAAGDFYDPLRPLASLPIMVLVYQGFYQLGLIRGGADAKAMMALTVLVPLYPDVSPFPLFAVPSPLDQTVHLVFPFSFVVFIDAAVLFLVVPLGYLIVNAVRGDLEFPVALFGTKGSLDHLPPHVWVMERVDAHGERVAVLFPSRTKDETAEIEKLRAAGATRVWVTHQIPFLVPLLAGFLLAFFVGNVVLGFLTSVLPHP